MDLVWSWRKEQEMPKNNPLLEEEENLFNTLYKLLELWRISVRSGVPFKVQKEGEESLPKFTYREYRTTAKWKELRDITIYEAEGKCQICNSPENLEVHHRTYERIGNEHLDDLTALCRKCHSKFHGAFEGKEKVEVGFHGSG